MSNNTQLNTNVTAGDTIATECFIFPHYKDKRGYGRVHVKMFGKKINLAHVLSWIEFNKRLPETGKQINHKCNNPSCCNPLHLYEGTQTENIFDQVRDGRHPAQVHTHENFGAKPKLSNSDIAFIRQNAIGRGKQRRLANQFSVSEALISGIVHNKKRTFLRKENG